MWWMGSSSSGKMMLGKMVCPKLGVASDGTMSGDVITIGDGTDETTINLLDPYPFPLKHVYSLLTGVGDDTFGDTGGSGGAIRGGITCWGVTMGGGDSSCWRRFASRSALGVSVGGARVRS